MSALGQALWRGTGELSFAMTALWPLACLCLLESGYAGLLTRNDDFWRQSFVIVYLFNLAGWCILTAEYAGLAAGDDCRSYRLQTRQKTCPAWVTHSLFLGSIHVVDILCFYTLPGVVHGPLLGMLLAGAACLGRPDIVCRYSPVSMLHAQRLLVLHRGSRMLAPLSLPSSDEELRFDKAVAYPVCGRLLISRVKVYVDRRMRRL